MVAKICGISAILWKLDVAGSTAEKKRRYIRLSSKFYYKSGQWSADFMTVVRVHKPSSCPTDYTFCFNTVS